MSNFQTNNRKLKLITLHFLVWTSLFLLPYLLSLDSELSFSRVVVSLWLPLIYYAIFFYINYFLLVKYLFEKRPLRYFFFNTLLVVSFIIIKNAVFIHFFSEIMPRPPKHDMPPPRLFVYWDVAVFCIPALFAVTIRSIERWINSETERTETLNMKLQAELQNLKYQLQPHFFFNALNNIYSLVDVSPEKAKETIHTLGKLMRYLLHDANTETVLLSNEIDFMKKYIELMKLRMPDRVNVQYTFPASTGNIEVPPLLFISLIENAFKHGVSAGNQSNIEFKLDITDEQLLFSSSNPNVISGSDDKSESGIGLQNLQKRLALLYPNVHHYNTTVKDNRFIATLNIPLKNDHEIN